MSRASDQNKYRMIFNDVRGYALRHDGQKRLRESLTRGSIY